MTNLESTPEALESAKRNIRQIMNEYSVDIHTHMIVDMLATLYERDQAAYVGILQAAVMQLL